MSDVATLQLASRVQPEHPTPLLLQLSPAERQVAVHLKMGMSTKEICEALGRSEGTVKNQVGQCLSKLGVPSRARLIVALFEEEIAKVAIESRGQSLHRVQFTAPTEDSSQ